MSEVATPEAEEFHSKASETSATPGLEEALKVARSEITSHDVRRVEQAKDLRDPEKLKDCFEGVTSALEREQPADSGQVAEVVSRLSREFRRSEVKGLYNSYSKIGKSERVIREPIPLNQADLAGLNVGLAQERIQALAEITDPFRFRHDQDTRTATREAAKAEADMIIPLLRHLPESSERDLLAVEAWKFFEHKYVARPEEAAMALELISSHELEQILKSIQENHVPAQERVAAAEEKSPAALAAVYARLHLDQGTAEKVHEEAQAAERAGVVHTKPEVLARVLFDSHRLLGYGEIETSGGTPDSTRRQNMESRTGRREKDDVLESRIVYGALAAGPDSKAVGLGDNRYGECAVTIKPEVVETRTTFSYGDSLRDGSAPLLSGAENILTVDDAVEAELLRREYEGERGRDPYYVEAQILGGVGVEDIESVSLPFNTGRELATTIAREYPHIEVIVRVDQSTIDSVGKEKLEAEATKLGLTLFFEEY
ncbi:MAG TPA: hypothetical protein VLF21_00700 [Candidatus Saccharimonadales bacterium]|nr:hypothetical protein [Candidatus Saccharimonadales bacterium]